MIFAFSNVYSKVSSDTIIVNGSKFVTKKKAVSNDFDGKDTAVLFYRIQDGKPKYLLRHFTYRYSGDCNNDFTDVGTYKIDGDSIIFMTEYLQKRSDPIPVRRRQVYLVEPSGKVIPFSDRELDRNGKWTKTVYKDE